MDIKKNKDLTPEQIAHMTDTFIGKKATSPRIYEDLNKIPYYLQEYRGSAMKKLKVKFIQQLEEAQKAEKKACAATGTIPMMQGTLYQEVIGLVQKCTNFFELEALARFVFDENEIPNVQQIRTRSRLLEGALGWKMSN